MTSHPPHPIHPGKSLGVLPLGASLHHILTILRQNPTYFPSISTIFSPSTPLTTPLILTLETNGLRLRFDGPDQRLRLIEITDFSKIRLTYDGKEVTRPSTTSSPFSSTTLLPPTCKTVYNKLIGPTYGGEYLPDKAVYILSYPGCAFTFPVDPATWKPDVDFASQLAGTPAKSLAIFSGESWERVRDDLFTRPVAAPRYPQNTASAARLSTANDEIEMVRIKDNGIVELVRRYNPPLTITLHATTPQDLVAELGAPNAIYRKSDHRLAIHGHRSNVAGETDLDDPSAGGGPGGSEDDDDETDLTTSGAGDCFYNYFHHGFDVFVSAHRSASHPVATKLILHGNVPGSYDFQRYRRCRWVVDLAATSGEQGQGRKLNGLKVDSEMTLEEMRPRLEERWGEGVLKNPMPFSRGADSPSSSCEFLVGWEDGGDDGEGGEGRVGKEGGGTFGNAELWGLPGMVLEILRENKAVTSLTVF